MEIKTEDYRYLLNSLEVSLNSVKYEQKRTNSALLLNVAVTLKNLLMMLPNIQKEDNTNNEAFLFNLRNKIK